MYRRIALIAPLLATLTASGGCSDDAVREYEGFCTATHDYQTDGTPDEITTNTYNSAGLQTRSERDTNADGVADQIRSFSYDGAGLLVSEEQDDDADGQPEDAFAYTHDAEGNLVRVERMHNGVVTSVSTYTYHPNRTTASERADQDGDGQWDIELQYDQHGELLQLGYDRDGDGVADHGQIWDRDAEGRILTHTTYQDVPFGDPAPNVIDTYAYDAAGYLVEIESYGYLPSEGIRGRTTVEWSLDHTDMVETRDDGDDGTVDSTVHKVWDSLGNLLLHEEDYNGDDAWDYWLRQAWEGELLVTTEEDDDLDGVVDRRTDYTYDAHGRVVRTELDVDSPPDGVPERVQTYSYDKAGNVTKIVEQDVATGTTGTTTYDYSCW